MCGHIFNYVAGPILCPHCREKMEAKFQEVKEYPRESRSGNTGCGRELRCGTLTDPTVAQRRETGADRRIRNLSAV